MGLVFYFVMLGVGCVVVVVVKCCGGGLCCGWWLVLIEFVMD